MTSCASSNKPTEKDRGESEGDAIAFRLCFVQFIEDRQCIERALPVEKRDGTKILFGVPLLSGFCLKGARSRREISEVDEALE
jgi:hypothetical protein